MAGGIDSQYGFLYQENAFILTALTHAGTNTYFTYEGVDDIDIENADLLYTIGIYSKSTYIQVKSGSVSENCMIRVIVNWINLDCFSNNLNLVLVVENDLSFSYNNENFAKKVISFIKAGKSKKKNSISRIAYDKYIEEIDSSDFKDKILNLFNLIKVEVKSFEAIFNEISSIYIKNYCQDIKISLKAKEKRIERFMNYIKSEIDYAISQKTKYVLEYSNLISIILKVKDEICDDKYITDMMQLRKKCEQEALEILKESNSREIEQLKLVNDNENFVIKGLINKLMYMDFREVYVESTSTIISNIEYQAKVNHEDVIDELEEFEKTPKLIYKNTIKKNISSELLPKESTYVKGCYIFLTSDEIEEDFQITWGCNNGE